MVERITISRNTSSTNGGQRNDGTLTRVLTLAPALALCPYRPNPPTIPRSSRYRRWAADNRRAQTGSTWDLLGRATSGPLEGKQLTGIPHSGSQLWFSWAVFQPNTEVYEN